MGDDTGGQQVQKAAAVMVPIKALLPWVRNPRKNDAAAVEVAKSIARFGFGSPILARQENGEIIAGHTRVKAALRLKMTEVPVRYLDLSESEAHALALADNKLGELAEWDDAGLADILRELRDAEVPIADLGWDDGELAAMLDGDIGGDGPTVGDDEVPDVEEGPPDSEVGGVYELGPHRLVCGDSTTAEAWEALLGAERLQMVWTDPPYGVAYVGKTKDALTIENDSLDEPALRALLFASLGAAATHTELGGAWYVAAPAGPLHNTFGSVLIELGIWRRSLIWLKDVFVMGRGDQHYRHEPIFYGWVPGAAHYWCGRRDVDTVFEVARPKRSEEHPTMKPVELVRQHIEQSSQPGWIVGDPFGGSGTTLLGAAASGRKARLIELSPAFCDVIRRRWTRWAKANGRDVGRGGLEG